MAALTGQNAELILKALRCVSFPWENYSPNVQSQDILNHVAVWSCCVTEELDLRLPVKWAGLALKILRLVGNNLKDLGLDFYSDGTDSEALSVEQALHMAGFSGGDLRFRVDKLQFLHLGLMPHDYLETILKMLPRDCLPKLTHLSATIENFTCLATHHRHLDGAPRFGIKHLDILEMSFITSCFHQHCQDSTHWYCAELRLDPQHLFQQLSKGFFHAFGENTHLRLVRRQADSVLYGSYRWGVNLTVHLAKQIVLWYATQRAVNSCPFSYTVIHPLPESDEDIELAPVSVTLSALSKEAQDDLETDLATFIFEGHVENKTGTDFVTYKDTIPRFVTFRHLVTFLILC